MYKSYTLFWLYFYDSVRLVIRKNRILSDLLSKQSHYQAGDSGNAAIRALIESGRPFFVGRLGFVESALAGVALTLQKFGLGKTLFKRVRRKMYEVGGFWPEDDHLLLQLGHLFLDSLPEIDLYVCWNTFLERYFSRFVIAPGAIRADFYSVEPFCFKNPWSGVLKGKRVLVICPYPETVLKQYEKRELLWADKSVLPNFELHVLKSIYGAASAPSCKTWFEALDTMYNDAMAIDFDVAILACGPYAIPLGCRIKRAGRSAITMCGVTQILFGIKGRRWDDRPYVARNYNEHWVRLDQRALPDIAKKLEGGCYL